MNERYIWFKDDLCPKCGERMEFVPCGYDGVGGDEICYGDVFCDCGYTKEASYNTTFRLEKAGARRKAKRQLYRITLSEVCGESLVYAKSGPDALAEWDKGNDFGYYEVDDADGTAEAFLLTGSDAEDALGERPRATRRQPGFRAAHGKKGRKPLPVLFIRSDVVRTPKKSKRGGKSK